MENTSEVLAWIVVHPYNCPLGRSRDNTDCKRCDEYNGLTFKRGSQGMLTIVRCSAEARPK